MSYRRQVCHVVHKIGVRQWRHLLNVSVKLRYLLAIARQVFGKEKFSRRRILHQAHVTSSVTTLGILSGRPVKLCQLLPTYYSQRTLSSAD